MEKSIFEKMGGTYEQRGDYLLPCLTLPAEKEQSIGVWGQRHLRYLKEYGRVTYITLLTSGRLNSYLADVDRKAQTLFFRLVKAMTEQEGITEQLKTEKQMEWVRKLNNINNRAKEIVTYEIIYKI